LRNEQKWSELSASKNDSKKRKCEDSEHSASSPVEETTRPKAAKASGKKTMVEGKDLDAFETMWSIKQQDLKIKERLSKMKILDSLIAKQEPLADY